MYSDDDLIEQIRLGDEKAAEDLTQETFLKLFKNLSGYKGKGKFKAYLYTIANRMCIGESRKRELYSLENGFAVWRRTFVCMPFAVRRWSRRLKD